MTIDEAKAAKIQAILKSREEQIRESWVKAMEARIVAENLKKCNRIEGVNHYEKCRHIAESYQGMLKDHKVKGYKVIDV